MANGVANYCALDAGPALGDPVPAHQILRGSARRAGSPFSPLQVRQHREVQRLISDDALEQRVLLLQQLQAFGLFLFECAIPDVPVLSERRATTHELDRFKGGRTTT